MTRILGIAGSLRKASFNQSLLRAAIETCGPDTAIETGAIADVPLYNADDEAHEGLPKPVLRLQEQLARADGLLIVTPEYNNSIPGVLKNVIDWMSRGAGLGLFHGKPVAVIGASPGGFGTVMSQAHWLPVLRALRTAPWFEGRLLVSRAGSVFDAEGNLADDGVRQELQAFMQGFADSLRREG